jgi:hypothetical protein
LFVNGSEALAVVGRDKDATWRSVGTLCRERSWSQQHLIYELEKGLPYRTDPPGWKVKWGSHLWPYFNVGASKLLVPPGGLRGIAPPPSTKHSDLLTWGVNLRIEVLPPDAEMPAPSENAPAASPAPARKVSEADLRNALRAIVEEHPPGSPPLDEESLRKKVEKRLGTELARDRILATRDEVAPHFKLPVGRPRKNAQ